jgi:exosortase C (VPDSG-CTERM-specific)
MTPDPTGVPPRSHRRRTLARGLSLALVGCSAFALPGWVRFGLSNDLYSYTLLVPLVCGYLAHSRRPSASAADAPLPSWVGLLLLGLGAASLAGYAVLHATTPSLLAQDLTAASMLPFVVCVAATATLWLPPDAARGCAFPLAFLACMIPLPGAVEHGIEAFLQHGSALPAIWLFQLIGTPVFAHDLVLDLPGISLRIAPECSGIRSTLVLFLTSLLAGHLFLRSPWRRSALAAAVLPLALLRNGFRVFTIGQLCVSVGPHMIESPIHLSGGPIFFALSLIPFLGLLLLLARGEQRRRQRGSSLAP